jgi:hypothetical protein
MTSLTSNSARTALFTRTLKRAEAVAFEDATSKEHYDTTPTDDSTGTGHMMMHYTSRAEYKEAVQQQ